TGLLNGSYNFSYSKPGFDTDYSLVIISGSNVVNSNKTIYDNTPPDQVTGLMNDTPSTTTINLSWSLTPNASYYQIFRNSSLTGTTQNIYWNDTGLAAGTTYQYQVRANDTYDNWGLNSATLDVTTAPPGGDTTPPTYTPPAPQGIDSTQGNFWINTTWSAGVIGNVTDSYNVSVNGEWTNGSSQPYNNSIVSPHGWINVTVYAYNSSGTGTLSSGSVSLNTQKSNNIPDQAYIGPKSGGIDSELLVALSINAGPILPSYRFINGTVIDSINKTGISGVTVSTNTSVNTTTNATGFYSLNVTSGIFNLTAKLDPTHYLNNTATVSTECCAVVMQDIELVEKLKGTISGSVTNG
ncbi:MAG: hypothetical protein O8C59_04675, partial [Candidatus Methanoperedens sp.]|nr:hypothetical protein [Candidatus Methanoperedens sp.]